MGIELDNEVIAKVRGEEAIISTPASKVKVVVIPTDEELLIASDNKWTRTIYLTLIRRAL